MEVHDSTVGTSFLNIRMEVTIVLVTNKYLLNVVTCRFLRQKIRLFLDSSKIGYFSLLETQSEGCSNINLVRVGNQYRIPNYVNL